MVRKDDTVKKYINSHKETTYVEDKMLDQYENIYLELNKELRTDNENIIHLQENVPCLFQLADRFHKTHYAFCVDFQSNPKGTVVVTFESSTPVEIYLSNESTKPDKHLC